MKKWRRMYCRFSDFFVYLHRIPHQVVSKTLRIEKKAFAISSKDLKRRKFQGKCLRMDNVNAHAIAWAEHIWHFGQFLRPQV